MNSEPVNCETYDPLISAMMDGEIESVERNELNSHLQNCARCKQRVMAFEQVDSAVERLSHKNLSGSESLNGFAQSSFPTVPFAMHEAKKKSLQAHRKSAWRLIPLAAAAMLLVCLGIALWPNPRPVNAGLISPSQIVEPMKELHFLNQETRRNQELMLRTLGMDLRSMKLEINHFELGSAERDSLSAQIDAMIEKVQTFEARRELDTTY